MSESDAYSKQTSARKCPERGVEMERRKLRAGGLGYFNLDNEPHRKITQALQKIEQANQPFLRLTN